MGRKLVKRLQSTDEIENCASKRNFMFPSRYHGNKMSATELSGVSTTTEFPIVLFTFNPCTYLIQPDIDCANSIVQTSIIMNKEWGLATSARERTMIDIENPSIGMNAFLPSRLQHGERKKRGYR